ncbi:unnamed protein product [Oncorhynchus mykiss]|uniref:Immunoglobulin I-set domain-containing protein n=1 Tax=Oncorhynchus mykiss TaxID=8022 RepID=A0A060Z8X4_ONCMY|nr:unnamed protein product [Oncorhynchus mykiss]
MAELDAGDSDFPDLTAFLSQDEINRSLDLAWEAFSDAEDWPALHYHPSLAPFNTTEYLTKSPCFPHQTKVSAMDDSHSVKVTSSQSVHLSRPIQATFEATASPEKFVCHKNITPVYKQDKPRLVHEGLELNERAASATEFCSRAATFIEELSSIFKGSSRLEQQGEEDSSSPDSGYLSPKSHRLAPRGFASVPPQPFIQQVVAQQGQPAQVMGEQHSGAQCVDGDLSLPHFIQKLKSQEVAEGHPIRLECRVAGNPQPLVRYGDWCLVEDCFGCVHISDE